MLGGGTSNKEDLFVLILAIVWTLHLEKKLSPLQLLFPLCSSPDHFDPSLLSVWSAAHYEPILIHFGFYSWERQNPNRHGATQSERL